MVVLTGRVDQLTEPPHVKTRAPECVRRWAVYASLSVVHCVKPIFSNPRCDRAEPTKDHRQRYRVIVNWVYPLLVIVGQPDDLDKNVMEKGEHV